MSKEENVTVRTYDPEKTEKVNTILIPVFDGEHKFKEVKKTFKKVGDFWKLAKSETRILAFDEVQTNLKDEIELPIIIKRVAVDTVNVKNIFGFFLTKSKIKANMPNMKLSISDNAAFLHQFDNELVSTQPISPVLPSPLYTINIDQKMKRISTEKAIELVKSGVKVYEENPNSLTANDKYKVFTVATGRKF